MVYTNKNVKILIPLPSYGFDPTEAAIPWKLFSRAGFNVFFTTPKGTKADCDSIMLTGKGLGIWRNLLKARKDAVIAYEEMYKNENYCKPLSYDQINPDEYDMIFLPGGHDKRVKEYLESAILQSIIPQFFTPDKFVGAVCHGVLLLARSINPASNKSVLYDYKTTSLLKSQEKLAYYLTKFWLGDYYLTYPETTIEDEVISVLKDKNQFLHGNFPIFRDTPDHLKYGFTVRDRNYFSARWPGDIYTLSFSLIQTIKSIK